MRVIILAAGSGKRFSDAGYKMPKPLIDVCGKTMLERTIEMVKSVDGFPLIVCRDELIQLNSFKEVLGEACVVHHLQQGAALSLLCANGYVADDEPVMVVNVDNLIEEKSFEEFARYSELEAESGHGVVLTTEAEGQAWSYVRTTEKNKILYIREKLQVSNVGTCGLYVFPSWRQCREGICNMVHFKDRTNGEYYLAPVYNYADHRSYSFYIEPKNFFPIGTPAQLEKFIKNLKS